MFHRQLPERISLYFYCATRTSRKFKKFKCNSFRYFLKYFSAQENTRENSKNYDHRKGTKMIKVINNVACKYLDTKVTLKRIWGRRLSSGKGNLFCLWNFWANRCSLWKLQYFWRLIYNPVKICDGVFIAKIGSRWVCLQKSSIKDGCLGSEYASDLTRDWIILEFYLKFCFLQWYSVSE